MGRLWPLAFLFDGDAGRPHHREIVAIAVIVLSVVAHVMLSGDWLGAAGIALSTELRPTSIAAQAASPSARPILAAADARAGRRG